MWDSVSLTFAIEKTLKEIFGAIIISDDINIDEIEKQIEDGLSEKDSKEIERVKIAKACRNKFNALFKSNIFCDCYAILYEIIINLKMFQFSKEQLLEIIDCNEDLILDSPYVRKDNFFTTSDGNIASDDDVIQVFKDKISELYDEVVGKVVSEEQFISDCNLYIDWYKKQFATYTALHMSSIMDKDGLEVREPGKRRRVYKGIDALREYFNKQMAVIRELDKNNSINHSIIDEEYINGDEEDSKDVEKKAIFDTGLREVDNVLGKFRRGNVLGIMGPPKGGKTRFTAYLANRALEMGLNVCVWPLEGTKEEWLAMIQASTVASKTSKKSGGTKADEIVRINSSDILQKKISDRKIIECVASAKIEMAIDPRRGRLSFIEGTAYVEDFLDELENHYDNKNQFDIIIIDQLVNIMSKTGRGKSERISEAYMNLKQLVANRLDIPAIAIIPCQMKQTAIDELVRGGDEADIDVTAGGESAETIRTPDTTIGIFASKEERRNDMTNLYCVATRHSVTFEKFTARAYYGCCYFCSMEE